jgi:hypothetical protein
MGVLHVVDPSQNLRKVHAALAARGIAPTVR